MCNALAESWSRLSEGPSRGKAGLPLGQIVWVNYQLSEQLTANYTRASRPSALRPHAPSPRFPEG